MKVKKWQDSNKVISQKYRKKKYKISLVILKPNYKACNKCL